MKKTPVVELSYGDIGKTVFTDDKGNFSTIDVLVANKHHVIVGTREPNGMEGPTMILEPGDFVDIADRNDFVLAAAKQ